MNRNQLINLSVVSYERVSTRTISSVYIMIESLELFKSVTVRVTYMDMTNMYVDSELITLDGPEYLSWGNDDTYLYNYISTKKGFVITQPSTLPVTSVVVEPMSGGTAGLGEETPAIGDTPVE